MLTQATDLVANKVAALAVARAREKLDLAKKMFAEDFKAHSKASWAAIREPRPSPVSIVQVQNQEGEPVLTANPSVAKLERHLSEAGQFLLV